MLAGVMGVLVATVLMACTGPAGKPAFAGYMWTVVSISHDGTTTPVSGKYSVYLQFTPDGHFGAHDAVNFHGGTYQATQGGFTTSTLYTTAIGYIGHDPVVPLSVSAMSAFDNGARATASVSGDTLTVTVGGYTLTTQRDGKQANLQGFWLWGWSRGFSRSCRSSESRGSSGSCGVLWVLWSPLGLVEFLGATGGIPTGHHWRSMAAADHYWHFWSRKCPEKSL